MKKKSNEPGGLPVITIDAAKVGANAQRVIELCRSRRIEAFPVLKALAGYAPLAPYIMAAGPDGLFDSHASDLVTMAKAGGIKLANGGTGTGAKPGNGGSKDSAQSGRLKGTEKTNERPAAKKRAGRKDAKRGPHLGILKLPSPSDISREREAMAHIDSFFVSEIAHIEALSKAASGAGVIIMTDTGDLREGVPLEGLEPLVRAALKPGKKIRIAGVATNHACFSGVIPEPRVIDRFAREVIRIEKLHGIEFPIVSGGNSSLLHMIAAGEVHPRVNNARIGEAILLGMDVLTRRPFEWLEQGAFVISAEVLECSMKDAASEGARTQNAFGELPEAGRRRGARGRKFLRAIVDLGKRHLIPSGLVPADPGIRILGASSDYLILDATGSAKPIEYGSRLEFILDYPALMSAMRSKEVEKRIAG